MSMKIDFDFRSEVTCRCKGKEDTDRAQCEGEYFGNVLINNRGWALVQWDTDEDPDLYKVELLLIEKTTWVSIP